MSQLAINVMSPSIQTDLNIDTTNIQLISTSFAVAHGGTLLLAGRIADIYGHKLCLLIGLSVFSAFSLASARADKAIDLAIFRAIQGLGAAAIAPSLLGIIARTFSRGSKMRTEGFSAFSTGSPLGTSIGLLIGDWMTQTTRPGWRSFFYFSLALSGLTCILSYFILPPDPPRDLSKGFRDVDWLGAFLLMSGLVLLVISLTFFPRFGWKSSEMLGPVGGALLIFVAFFGWEIFVDRKGFCVPLLPVSLFKNRYFLALQILSGLVYLAFTNHNYFLNYYFQVYLKQGLIESMLRFLPLFIVSVALNFITAHLVEKCPAQAIIIIGCLATVASSALSSFMDPDAIYWKFNFVAIVLSVIGADFMFSTVSMFGSVISNDDEQGIAGAVILSFTRIFSVIGLGIAIISQEEAATSTSKDLGVTISRTSISSAPREAYWKGLQAGFFVFFASSLLATLISVTFLWGMGYVGPRITKEKNESSQSPETAETTALFIV
ncbi:major facilitator superfamily domain-containing protein [Melampsora americana]|nr:major facilitator superfamily domain-containing protein [Melampsora americana]